MSNIENILGNLSSSIDGFDLVDVKFFVGSRRDVTQEEFCAEAEKAVAQFSSGEAKAKVSIDGHLDTVSIHDFIG